MSKFGIMIDTDKTTTTISPPADKKQKRTIRNRQLTPLTTTMTGPVSAKRPNNKWDAVMSKMAETKHRPINVKEIKSKVFNPKVNVIPSHNTTHRLQEKEQQDPNMKSTNQNKGGKLVPRSKPDRGNRLPRLLKETFSSQSSTLSSSSEEHSHHPKLSKQTSSSSSCPSSRTVINPSLRPPTVTVSPILKTPPRKLQQELLDSNKPLRGLTSLQEIQSLRVELLREKERTVEELNSIRQVHNQELEATSRAHEEAIQILRRKYDFALAGAERRLQEVRSDLERQSEHAREELDSFKHAHTKEIESISLTYQQQVTSLKEALQSETKLLKLAHQSDLNELRATLESSEYERNQRHEFKLNELKTKHVEEIDKLESQYKVEIELLKQKLKDYPKRLTSASSSGHSKEVRSELHERFLPHPLHSSTDLLHKEIKSLRVVVDLRNSEIKELRQDSMSLSLQLEQFQGVQEQNNKLMRRVEDLEAQVTKTRDDKKKLMEENQSMHTSIHEAFSAKERLLMEIEFLRYKIESNSSEDGSLELRDGVNVSLFGADGDSSDSAIITGDP